MPPSFSGKLCLVLLACLFLPACSTVSEEDNDLVAVHNADDGIGYPDIARELSDGRVLVYDITADGALQTPPAPAEVMPGRRSGGAPSAVDSNVTIFPLDGSDAPVMQAAPMRPGLMPPSAATRPLPAPFGGALQTAPQQPAAPAARNTVPDNLSKVHFRHGSARLGPDARQLADQMRRGATGRIVVDGHASERAEVSDPVERSIVNLEMSMDRALAVSSALIRSGVPAEAIETRAFGDTRPIAAEEAANRRVEVRADILPRTASPVPAPQGNMAAIPPLARY